MTNTATIIVGLIVSAWESRQVSGSQACIHGQCPCVRIPLEMETFLGCMPAGWSRFILRIEEDFEKRKTEITLAFRSSHKIIRFKERRGEVKSTNMISTTSYQKVISTTWHHCFQNCVPRHTLVLRLVYSGAVDISNIFTDNTQPSWSIESFMCWCDDVVGNLRDYECYHSFPTW